MQSGKELQPLAESHERVNFALQAGRIGYWEFYPEEKRFVPSEMYKANWGRAPGDPCTFDDLLKAIHPDDLDRHQRAFADAIRTRKPLDIEYRTIWPDGSVHWLRVRGQAIYGTNGEPVRIAGISMEITDRKRVEESLLEESHTLETLNRIGKTLAADLDLESIVQNVTDAATELSGARFGAFFYNVTDDKGEALVLYTLSGAPREAFEKFGTPRNTAVFEPTFRGTGIVRSDDITKDPRYGKNAPHNGMPKGHLPVRSYLAVPVISRTGKVLGGLFFGHDRTGVFTERAERIVAGIAAQAAIAIDNAHLFRDVQHELTERRRGEELQRLLLAELNHRVKNTLAIVQSIATQTLRNSDTAKAFRDGFEARIIALSEAHDLLTEGNWEGTSLQQIVQSVMRPYEVDGASRYRLTGSPELRVGPQTAVTLVLVFHELATNAAKYGALSTDQGTVEINVSHLDGSQPRLHVHWEESGGPRVRPATRSGFGSKLVRTLTNVSHRFDPTGVVCTFDFPLTGAE